MPLVQQRVALAKDRNMEVLSWKDWVAALVHASQIQGLAEVPGIKLIDFYKTLSADKPLPVLETTETIQKSSVLKGLGAVDEAWMGLWLDQWGYSKEL